MRKSTLLVSTAIGLTLICNPLVALPHKAPSVDFAKAPAKLKKAKAAAPSPRHLSLHPWKTFLSWGTTMTAVPAGFLAEDPPFQIDCKSACLIVTRNLAELDSYYSYEVALCPVVDGYFTNGSCYFSGTISSHDLYANRTNQTNYTIGAGQHAFQTYLYTVAPAYLGRYQNEYEVWRLH